MTQEELDKLDKAKLAEACQTALNCFRAMFDAIKEGMDADDLYDDPRFWPLSLLRFALGDESDKDEAEQNWRDGEYVGSLKSDLDDEHQEDETPVHEDRD